MLKFETDFQDMKNNYLTEQPLLNGKIMSKNYLNG